MEIAPVKINTTLKLVFSASNAPTAAVSAVPKPTAEEYIEYWNPLFPLSKLAVNKLDHEG